MSIVALLTFIVITFALMVGSAIGWICGLEFTSDSASWIGGAMTELIKFAGGDDFAALPVVSKPSLEPTQESPIKALISKLFGESVDINWATIDVGNLTPEIMNKLYKLYISKHEKKISGVDVGDNSDDSDNITNIVEVLAIAGVKQSPEDNEYVDDSPIVYADVGARDCKTTLEIANSIKSAKIYNINHVNNCTNQPILNYISGLEKTFDIPSNSVNVVTVINSLHNYADQEHKLNEIKRILAPNGILCIRDYLADDDKIAAMIRLKHLLYYIDSLTNMEVILEYNEFKKLLTTYFENQLYLFDHAKLDKMTIGGESPLTELEFKPQPLHSFIATYKKITT
jgi:SAM-dependent methyltransferase